MRNQVYISELFYFGFLVILFFAKGIGLYDGQFIFKVCLVAAISCFVMKMIMTAYSLREFAVIGILLIIGALVYLVSGEKGALLYIMMITGMKGISAARIFKVSFVAWMISFGGMFILTAVRIIDSPFKIHERFGLGHLIRWGLGHSHPNVLHISYLTLVMMAIYLAHTGWLKIKTIKLLAFLMLGNLYVYLYSLSTTGFISVSILLALNLYWHCRKRFSLVEKWLINAFLPLCLCLTFIAPLILSGRAFEIVNKLVNTRLNLSRHFLRNQPTTLFGTRIADITNHWYTMDNSFLFAYVIYGIVLFSIIILAYVVLINRYLKKQKGIELSLIIASLAAGITEPFLFNGSFKNVPLLFFGEMVYNRENIKAPIRFLPEKVRMLSVPLPKLSVYAVFKRLSRLRFSLIFLTGFLSGALLSVFLISYPTGYIAPRKHCEMERKDTSIYLESKDQVKEANIRVLEYIDSETKMEYFSGNIVVMEQVRDIITFGLLAGMLGIIVSSLRVKRKI